MVHKRFVKKDGKTYGPYYYHNKRVDGKVVSSYHGTGEGGFSYFNLLYLVLVLMVVGSVAFVFFGQEGPFLAPEEGLNIELEGNQVSGLALKGVVSGVVSGDDLIDSTTIISLRSGGEEIFNREVSSPEFFEVSTRDIAGDILNFPERTEEVVEVVFPELIVYYVLVDVGDKSDKDAEVVEEAVESSSKECSVDSDCSEHFSCVSGQCRFDGGGGGGGGPSACDVGDGCGGEEPPELPPEESSPPQVGGRIVTKQIDPQPTGVSGAAIIEFEEELRLSPREKNIDVNSLKSGTVRKDGPLEITASEDERIKLVRAEKQGGEEVSLSSLNVESEEEGGEVVYTIYTDYSEEKVIERKLVDVSGRLKGVITPDVEQLELSVSVVSQESVLFSGSTIVEVVTSIKQPIISFQGKDVNFLVPGEAEWKRTVVKDPNDVGKEVVVDVEVPSEAVVVQDSFVVNTFRADGSESRKLAGSKGDVEQGRTRTIRPSDVESDEGVLEEQGVAGAGSDTGVLEEVPSGEVDSGTSQEEPAAEETPVEDTQVDNSLSKAEAAGVITGRAGFYEGVEDLKIVFDEDETLAEIFFKTEGPSVRSEFVPGEKRVEVFVESPIGVDFSDVPVFVSGVELPEELGRATGLHDVKIRKAGEDVSFQPLSGSDIDGDGSIDEIEFIGEGESSYVIIIEITAAEHLDENRFFISDIYDEVRTQDGIWSEPIKNEEYARVTFEKPLTNENDITIYARSDGLSDLLVYPLDGEEPIAAFRQISQEDTYKVFLSDMADNETYDIFDLRVLGGEMEFDLIIDPTVGACATISTPGVYTLTQDLITTGTCFTVTSNDVILDGAGFSVTGDGDTGDFGVTASGVANIEVWNLTIMDFDKGINFDNVDSSSIENVVVDGVSGEGIRLSSGSSGSVLVNNSINLTNVGIQISGGGSNVLTDTRVTNFGLQGIRLDAGSSSNVVDGGFFENSTGPPNADAGVFIFRGSHNIVRGVTVRGIPDFGIGLNGIFAEVAENNTFENNTLIGNARGILIGDEAGGDNTLKNNLILGSTEFSILDQSSSLETNYFSYNNSFGEIVWTDNSSGGFLRNLTVKGDIGFDVNLSIGDNSVFLASEEFGSSLINSSANITLYGIGDRGFVIPAIFRDGEVCPADVCSNFTALDAQDVKLNVTGWTNYFIGDSIAILGAILNAPENNTQFSSGVGVLLNATIIETEGDTVDGKIFARKGGESWFNDFSVYGFSSYYDPRVVYKDDTIVGSVGVFFDGEEIDYNLTALPVRSEIEFHPAPASLILHFDDESFAANADAPGGYSSEIHDFSGWSIFDLFPSFNFQTSFAGDAGYDKEDAKFGWSASFDGVGDYIESGFTSEHLTVGTDFSFGGWIKCPALTGPTAVQDRVVFSTTDFTPPYTIKSSNAPDGAALTVAKQSPLGPGPTTARFWILDNANGDALRLAGSERVCNNQWHHIIVSADRDGLGKIYVDGELDSQMDISGAGSGQIFNSQNSIFGGAPPAGTDRNFEGKLDEFVVWPRALTDDEVRDLYRLPDDKYFWKVDLTDSGGDTGESEEREFTVGSIALNDCAVLDEEGRVYELENNIGPVVGTCFEITADDVTLNGNGFYVQGDGMQGPNDYGVVVNQLKSGTKITNINISGFDNGVIFLKDSFNGSVENSILNFNGINGISLVNVSENIKIINNEISNNFGFGGASGGGVRLVSTQNNLIDGNVISSNGGVGGIVFSGGNSNKISNNNISSNNQAGMRLHVSSNLNNLIENNSVSGSEIGLLVLGSGNMLLNNQLFGNSQQSLSILGAVNYLVYNNSFGEIRWTDTSPGGFLESMELDGDIGHGVNLEIKNNSAFLNTAAFSLGQIDSASTVKLYGIGDRGFDSPVLIRNGVLCLSPTCEPNTPLDAETVSFNVTGWDDGTGSVQYRVWDGLVPVLVSPPDGSLVADRTPEFTWLPIPNSVTPNYFYDFSITLIDPMQPGVTCTDTISDETGLAHSGGVGELQSFTLTQDLNCFYDEGYYYNWTVRAYRAVPGEGPWAEPFALNLSSFVNIVLTNDPVDFGTLVPLGSEDTVDDAPLPFGLENGGNVDINISLAATDLWDNLNSDNPTPNYQYLVNEYGEPGAFNPDNSQMSFAPVPDEFTFTHFATELNYEDNMDICRVDLEVTVPADEPPGQKNSLITFQAERAE